jgi:hypothetical protein
MEDIVKSLLPDEVGWEVPVTQPTR